MGLSQREIIEAFERDGFVIMPRLFRLEEVKAIKREIIKVLDEARRQAAESNRGRSLTPC